MALDFIDRPVDSIVPLPYTRPAFARPRKGIVLHHTGVSFDPTVRREGSWAWLVGKNTLYRDVFEDDIAHHVAATDRWLPPWVEPSPYAVSDVNWCTIGVEITYAPQNGEVPNDFQYTTLRALLADIFERYGVLPVVGHGQLQLDKWPTEPHGLDWARLGFGPFETNWGYPWLGTPPEDDEEAMLTPDERDALQMLRDLSWNRASIETAINRVGRAREVGQTILRTKRVPAIIKPLAAEMASWD
jgi:hypothetical protein